MAKAGAGRTTKSTSSTSKSRTRTAARASTAAKKTQAAKATTPKVKAMSANSDVFSISPMTMMTPDAAGMPESMRTIAEKTLLQTKAAYETAKDTVEEATDAVESSLGLASANAKALNVKLIDMAQTNMESGFEFMRELACAKDVSDALKAHSSYVREQMAAASNQAQEIRDFTQEMAQSSAKPIQDHMTKSWSKLQMGS